jgi:hypothetical protein
LSFTSNQEIQAYLESFEKQAKAIKHEALRMCWYMRGGLTYTESMALSNQERDIIAGIVKDNIEATKKSGMPFF